MIFIRVLMGALVLLLPLLDNGIGQTDANQAKKAAPAKPKSKEYQAIEDKVRKIVAEYYRVEASEIDINVPICKRDPNAGEVTIVMVLMKVEKALGIDFQKEYGEKDVKELAEKLTVESVAVTAHKILEAKKAPK